MSLRSVNKRSEVKNLPYWALLATGLETYPESIDDFAPRRCPPDTLIVQRVTFAPNLNHTHQGHLIDSYGRDTYNT